MPPTPEWYDDRERLALFTKVMFKTAAFPEDEIFDILLEPWKWNDEFTIWQRWEYPQDDYDEKWGSCVEELEKHWNA